MSIFRRKPRKSTKPSPAALASVARAAQDLADQKKKHVKGQEVMARITEALEKNHLAQLMYEALDAQRHPR